jgi:hypothetical protein
VVHAIFVSRGFASDARERFRQEQWVDAATGEEREVDTVGSRTIERLSGRSLTETWSSDQGGTMS